MNAAAESGSFGSTGMNRTSPDGESSGEKSWTRTRWLVLVALIFGAHVGLLFAFGARTVPPPRRAMGVPTLTLTRDAGELVALTDPTLFALPHRRDFVADFRMQIPDRQPSSFRRTETSGTLSLASGPLGTTFDQFMQTNPSAVFPLHVEPPPRLSTPVSPIAPILAQDSTLLIAGDIAQRSLLNPVKVPSLPHNDVLAPSQVQVLVNAAGNVVSTTLLPPGSGWDEADRRALELARTARFSPGPRLTLGQLVFNWHTVPLPATNAPAPNNE